MNLPIQSVADRYAAAVSNMEVRWKLLQTRKFDPRLLVQYVRSLRQCGRLRARIESMIKEGAL